MVENAATLSISRKPQVPSRMGTLRRLRAAQIRLTSAVVADCSRVDLFSSMLRTFRHWPVTRQAIDLVAGFNRVFPDLDSARDVAAKYAECSHESDRNAQALFEFMEAVRPSDYPAMLHLSRLVREDLRVFDLGGTMGNLFYLYNRYLSFPQSVRWTVHDLPGNMAKGRELARQRNESRVRFAEHPDEANGHDVLLISGSLHYFEFSLPEFIQRLASPPRHIIVNRTPLVDAPAAATVQSIHGVTVACKLLNRRELIQGMERFSYQISDSWTAPEFSIRLPYDQDYWVRAYQGLYFQARD